MPISILDLKDWAIPILGIVLTVAFGWYPIKKAIGADTERRAHANQEFQDLIVRRLILEDFWPDPAVLQQMREGVALKFGLRAETLISDVALRSAVIFQVAANDYVEAKRRTELIKRITETAVRDEKIETALLRQSAATRSSRPSSRRWELWPPLAAVVVGMVAAIAADWLSSLASGVVPVGFALVRSLRDVALPVGAIGVMLLGLLGMTLYWWTRRQREALDRVSIEESAYFIALSFEQTVSDLLVDLLREEKIDSFEHGGPKDKYDFLVWRRGKKLLIEAKQIAKTRNIGDWVYQLRHALERTGANEAIIVIPDEDEGLRPRLIKSDQGVRIMTLSSFAAYLRLELAA